MKAWIKGVRLSVLVVVATALVLTAACGGGDGGGGSSKSTNPEVLAMDFVTAVLQGDVETAKEFIVPERVEQVQPKVDDVVNIMAQYDADELEIGSTRPTGFLGDTNAKRVEIRFVYRPKGDDGGKPSIGLIGVVMAATGSRYQVTDVALEKPQE